jgi:hypothetical protein
MYSGPGTLAGGFPHSDISGSMLICQLPGAFRRLSRLSSPVIAKASTSCTYSLDSITLSPPADMTRKTVIKINVCPTLYENSIRLKYWSIQSNPYAFQHALSLRGTFGSSLNVGYPRIEHAFRHIFTFTSSVFLKNNPTFHTIKGEVCRLDLSAQSARLTLHDSLPTDFTNRAWWVWMGSNHRPPPYQDGALTS